MSIPVNFFLLFCAFLSHFHKVFCVFYSQMGSKKAGPARLVFPAPHSAYSKIASVCSTLPRMTNRWKTLCIYRFVFPIP